MKDTERLRDVERASESDRQTYTTDIPTYRQIDRKRERDYSSNC